MKKKIIVTIVLIIGIVAIAFWLCFLIVAARNEVYVFDLEKANTGESSLLYYKDGDINYYTDDIKSIEVSKLRLIFKTDKKELSEYIEDGSIRELLDELSVYKYYFNYGLETKYYNRDRTFVITKCHYYHLYDKVEYHINDEYIQTECNRYS